MGSGLSFNQDRIELGQQYPQQVASTKDADKDVLPQKSPEASVMPLNPIDDVDVPIEDSTPLEAIVEGVEESHSPSPQDDERNREYLRLCCSWRQSNSSRDGCSSCLWFRATQN